MKGLISVKNIVIATMMLASLSLDASGVVGSASKSVSCKVARALHQEKRIYTDVIDTIFRIDQNRSKVGKCESIVAQYSGKKDLEEHEYIQKFNARRVALLLKSEIDRDVDILRWLKMQNLGFAFGQSKAVLQKYVGQQAADEHDRLQLEEYSKLAKSLESNIDKNDALVVKKEVQKAFLIVIASAKKELK